MHAVHHYAGHDRAGSLIDMVVERNSCSVLISSIFQWNKKQDHLLRILMGRSHVGAI